nr:Ig-like domain-containing protein [uncultured Clostridium sp.]
MSKRALKRLATCICLMICVLFLGQISAYAATIGSVLRTPESGWQRYDDQNGYFYYQGTWNEIKNGSPAYYKGEMVYSRNSGESVKFKFKGSKLRITHQLNYNRSAKIQVKIDDIVVGSYSIYHPTLSTDQCLVFEKNDLIDGVHYVELTNLDPNLDLGIERLFCFDAIDIDSTGELLPYDRLSTNLIATGSTSKIDLTWGTVDKATSYTVKRSTTAGGPYETISTDVTGTTYTDTNVTNGTNYYYIITAIVAGRESGNSNEASATPEASQTPPTTEAKLKVVLEVSEALRLSVDDDLNVNTQMAWSSSDPTVATVNEKGIVTALAPGNTVITVKSVDGSYTDYINVLVVENADDYRLAIDLKIGETARLTADNFTNTANITWAPMDSSIANVTSKGKVTALSKGLVLISAKDAEGNVIGRVYVRVRE